MEHGRTAITEAVRSVQLLKIDGYCPTSGMRSEDYIKSRWIVDGHEWEVRFYPTWYQYLGNCTQWIALKLSLLSEPQRGSKLKANLRCRFVHPTRLRDPSAEEGVSQVFVQSGQCSYGVIILMSRKDVESSGFVVNDSLTVQCTVTVLKEPQDVVIPANTEVPLPPSDLHRHLGELWQDRRGADVSFVLEYGGCFFAHKAILAARSPVFMAEFFGAMSERSSQSVRIQGMEPAVFKAMLHFIYTDTAPQLEGEPEVAMAMAQHLLAAADRYGLDRLKLICEGKLSGGISIDTVATTLALAEQHNCSLLKAKCIDFIARSPETLDAVVATEGYNHLFASCPSVVTQLLRAARGRRF